MRGAIHSKQSQIREVITSTAVKLPALVLSETVLDHNIKTFASYIKRQPRVVLAPHGKTTLCPAIFKQQLSAGAWGITVASVDQAEIACTAGAKRILIANEVVESTEISRIRALENTYQCDIFLGLPAWMWVIRWDCRHVRVAGHA